MMQYYHGKMQREQWGLYSLGKKFKVNAAGLEFWITLKWIGKEKPVAGRYPPWSHQGPCLGRRRGYSNLGLCGKQDERSTRQAWQGNEPARV